MTMPKESQDDAATIVDEILSYILVYAPDFPVEDATTTEDQFDKLLRRVRALWNGIQDVERRRWLDLLGREIVEARSRFLTGDSQAGRSLIQSVQEHFKSWRELKKMRPTFIVGPGGDAKKVK